MQVIIALENAMIHCQSELSVEKTWNFICNSSSTRPRPVSGPAILVGQTPLSRDSGGRWPLKVSRQADAALATRRKEGSRMPHAMMNTYNLKEHKPIVGLRMNQCECPDKQL